MPVAAHSSSSSPFWRAYATMHASTPSTCLRSDSDSVHSQKRRQASSRSTSLMGPTYLPRRRYAERSCCTSRPYDADAPPSFQRTVIVPVRLGRGEMRPPLSGVFHLSSFVETG